MKNLKNIFYLAVLNIGSIIIGYTTIMYNKNDYPNNFNKMSFESSCIKNESCLRDSYVLITTTLPIGAFLGLFLGLPLLYYFGKRFLMILSDILIIVAVIIVQPFSYVLTTLISRLIFGVFCGINLGLVTVFSHEIIKISGYNENLLSIQPIFINLGYLIGIMDFSTSTDVYVIMSFSLLRLLFICFYFKWESPLFIMHRKPDDSELLNQSMNLYLLKDQKKQEDDLKLQEMKQKINEIPSFFSKDFEIIDILMSPYGKNLLISIILCILYQISGVGLFLYYSSQIQQLYTKLMVGILLIITCISCFLLNFSKNHRKLIFSTSFLIPLFLLLMFFNCGYGNTAGVNLIHFFVIFAVQSSLGAGLWIFIVNLLPDLGVILSGIGFWGMNYIIALAADLENIEKTYYGRENFFLVLCVLSTVLVAILLFFLRETKENLNKQ